MDNRIHNQIVSFIWGIADDVLRDVFVRGKYRDIILPFTVLRRIDVLLEETKEKVLEANKFMEENNIDDKSALTKITKYPFYNISPFTMGLNGPRESQIPFVSLLSDPDKIDSNLEIYLDGFSPNIQEIISKFKIRNQLETIKEAGITFNLIEKFTSNSINLSPEDVINSKGEKLPGLSNLGMGYVFEELIRKFNEENNEEAGEHFTPREIIRLMTHILFEPVQEKLKEREGARFTIYDSACGSGGMLTEAEKFALEITNNKCSFSLFGQEVNPETWAICTGDMLIKGEKSVNIGYGSTLSNDASAGKKFDFMLSNPPYGKTWKIDEDAIVDDRGKKGKENIKDTRFKVGLPSISDGQLLFLVNMISKMKEVKKDLGSRIASVHNGSSLFTGDAGQGESEIRKMIIEKDLLECIIALPTNIFYNTGIPTYIWILSNNKTPERKGKVQLINAIDVYEKLRKNLGKKNCELTEEQIRYITQTYMDFKETDISKKFNNEDFGYWKITIERPLRLKANITKMAVESLRYNKMILDEMNWVYKKFGDEVYLNLKPYKKEILKWIEKNEIKITSANLNKLFDCEFWEKQKMLMEAAEQLYNEIGNIEFDDFNEFKLKIDEILSKLGIKLNASDKKIVLDAFSWKDEEAKPVIKKIKSDGTVLFQPDPDLRDSENVPLNEDINEYFNREVLKYVPDAWIDESKTIKGYSISFTRYFYSYQPPRSLEEISKELKLLENETKEALEEFLND
ncbi:SAM-dependent DNA methyltransferase [Clostridium botulinum]|uniref:type I restriction-modification system subunit M n=1 Tax=Clostridium botulinum TaxID=1491 RepID=UPI001DC050A5|nr:type I restriction-modification system subunit M [Clostridium botulinum]MBY6795627.1 SAM-dependent DNA methyltransferase [Clostridium botulinum]MBY6865442.1 SAM-dependent DNA methyltransferase [Clostridium botulinum]MBY6871865.1 SAM-dependent DNA methyltransferase [Clostridium botulinum]MBY6888131.1 SAM-dependent DNA methyltransferase [Clostridium botulinum]